MVGESLKSKIVESLSNELSSDAGFNSSILEEKVANAIQEVIDTRKYPVFYSESQIDEDLSRFQSKIRKIALYDYNTVGAEFQSAHNENGISRSFVNREKLFSGIIPIAKF
jgi:hypothetical protein